MSSRTLFSNQAIGRRKVKKNTKITKTNETMEATFKRLNKLQSTWCSKTTLVTEIGRRHHRAAS